MSSHNINHISLNNRSVQSKRQSKSQGDLNRKLSGCTGDLENGVSLRTKSLPRNTKARSDQNGATENDDPTQNLNVDLRSAIATSQSTPNIYESQDIAQSPVPFSPPGSPHAIAHEVEDKQGSARVPYQTDCQDKEVNEAQSSVPEPVENSSSKLSSTSGEIAQPVDQDDDRSDPVNTLSSSSLHSVEDDANEDLRSDMLSDVVLKPAQELELHLLKPSVEGPAVPTSKGNWLGSQGIQTIDEPKLVDAESVSSYHEDSDSLASTSIDHLPSETALLPAGKSSDMNAPQIHTIARKDASTPTVFQLGPSEKREEQPSPEPAYVDASDPEGSDECRYAKDDNGVRSNILEEGIGQEMERARRKQQVTDGNDHYFPYAYRKNNTILGPATQAKATIWSSSPPNLSTRPNEMQIRKTTEEFPKQIDLSLEHFSHASLAKPPIMSMVISGNKDKNSNVEILNAPSAPTDPKYTPTSYTSRRLHDLSPQPRDWFSTEYQPVSNSNSANALSQLIYSSPTLPGDNQSQSTYVASDTRLPGSGGSPDHADISRSWTSDRDTGHKQPPFTTRALTNRDLLMDNGYKPYPTSIPYSSTRDCMSSLSSISDYAPPPTTATKQLFVHTDEKFGSFPPKHSPTIAEIRAASNIATDKLSSPSSIKRFPVSTGRDPSSTFFSQLQDSPLPTTQGNAEKSRIQALTDMTNGSLNHGLPPTSMRQLAHNLESKLFKQMETAPREGTGSGMKCLSQTVLPSPSARSSTAREVSIQTDQPSMHSVSQNVEAKLRQEIEQPSGRNESNMRHLSRTVLPQASLQTSPTMCDKGREESVQTSHTTANQPTVPLLFHQLFCYVIVAFVVYKITLWLNVSTSTTQHSDSYQSSVPAASHSEQNHPQRSSIWYMIFRTLLRWLTGF